MKKPKPKLKAAPPIPDSLLAANIILRSASGKKITAARRGVTPRTIHEYLPSRSTLQEASRLLRELGFEIRLVAPTHIAIEGSKKLFERTFKVRLTKRFAPYLQNAKGEGDGPAVQHYYAVDVAPRIPKKLATVVEMLEFPGAVTYFVSSTPPPLSYYHLEVPDDVAQGMNATKAHELGITGYGIKVAMVDSGFKNPFHPYYDAQNYDIQPLWPGSAESGAYDPLGHGTAVAACALAVAPGITFTPYSTGVNVVLTFSYVAMQGPDIITCSWGLWKVSLALRLAINKAVADGIVVCFACGNAGVVGWPSTEPAVISVGGVYIHEDGSLEASSYASSGKAHGGRTVPDLCGIVGTKPHGVFIALPTTPNSLADSFFGCSDPVLQDCDVQDGTTKNDGWLVASGTSSATPMVAATAALIMQANPTTKGDPEAIRSILIESCRDVTTGKSASGHSAGPGTDLATGAGLVDAYKAVEVTGIHPPLDTLEVLVNPLAILLGDELFAKINKPYPVLGDALLAQVRELVPTMTSDEKNAILARLNVIGASLKQLKEEFER
jgi:serine protease AprX